MKKFFAFTLCFFALFQISAKAKSKSTKTGPILQKGEYINKSIKERELSQKIQEYSPDVKDADSSKFFMIKYSSASTASWGCHDPKLFQDDDGTFYVYSTGWSKGAELRSSKDLIHWTKHTNSPLWNPSDISQRYRHMLWDDDFLKWVGYQTNSGEAYGTSLYLPSASPNSWAPTVIKQNGKYYMFHGIITDCLTSSSSLHPAAIITLAISDSPKGPFVPAKDYDSSTYKQSTLVRYVWTNEKAQNSQIGYNSSYNSAGANWSNGFGTIDPEIIYDIDTGTPKIFDVDGTECYGITYGSWKGGIALVYVDSKTFKPVASTAGKSSFNGLEYKRGEIMDAPLDSIPGNSGLLLAGGSGAAYEGAQVIYSSKYDFYYVFVSMGYLDKEYRVGVGRSKNLEGPYLDTSGQNMKFEDDFSASSYHAVGGKIIGAYQLGNDYGFKSPGGQSILRSNDGKILFAAHSRTAYLPNHLFTLQVREMHFNKEGWPLLNINEFSGKDDFSEKISIKDFEGKYDVIISQRDANAQVDGTATLSKKITVDGEGKISGDYTGLLSLEEDGSSISVDLGKDKVFYGFASKTLDPARKDSSSIEKMQTLTFTALCTQKGDFAGEYIFANKN